MEQIARSLYPECAKEEDEDLFFGASDYQPIINSFGEAIIQVDDSDCQGDTRVVLKKDDQYGLLIFGWGSCSGCDALQGCSSLREIDELIEGLRNEIKWFDSWDGLLKYVNEKDWELDWAWHSDETKQFIEKIKSFTP